MTNDNDSYICDRCSAPATVVQARYRGNSDDRHGPIVLYRCEQHRVDGLETTALTSSLSFAPPNPDDALTFDEVEAAGLDGTLRDMP